MYGNDALWVTIPTDGITRTLDLKIPAVRLVAGSLTGSATRLDASAPPGEVIVLDGYGSIGFQASGVRFPTPGCWEITHQLAGRQLRFVLWVEG
jgi:hypothetical protein